MAFRKNRPQLAAAANEFIRQHALGTTFGNVEQVVSGRIGRETVAHVSQVFKYYIAYRLAAEKAAQRARDRWNGSG